MSNQQYGGAKYSASQLTGVRTLTNGARGGFLAITKKDGTPGKRFVIFDAKNVNMAALQAARRRPITQAQAQTAFDKYYKNMRTAKYRRGPQKGKPRFHSPRGIKAARTYDLGHTMKGSRVISDARYLHNPHRYDYTGVDTGAKVRKVSAPSAKQLAARAAFTARAKARSRAGLQAQLPFANQQQVGGYWW